MNNKDIAQHYFDLSNNSDFDGISALFKPSTTYCSRLGDIYLGKDNIMKMQRSYHNSFISLCWHINNIRHINADIIVIDFNFEGLKKTSEIVTSKGTEFIVIYQKKIQHIDVRM